MQRLPTFVSRARRAVRAVRDCTWPERRELIGAVCTAGAVAGLLYACSFRRTLHVLSGWARLRLSSSSPSDEEEERILWATEVACRRLLPERPCLTQALTARVLLARRGARVPELEIGVKRQSDGTLEAHAWLERDQEVLIGGRDAPATYRPLRDGVDES